MIAGCTCRACRTRRPAPPLTRLRPAGTAPALATTRRLQALARLGHTPAFIAAETGTGPEMITMLMVRPPDTLQAVLAARISELYDRAWDVRPEGPDAEETRRIAAASNWALPLCWDDETIGSPTARPAGMPGVDNRKRTGPVAFADVEFLLKSGAGFGEILARAGATCTDVLKKRLYRRGRLDLLPYIPQNDQYNPA